MNFFIMMSYIQTMCIILLSNLLPVFIRMHFYSFSNSKQSNIFLNFAKVLHLRSFKQPLESCKNVIWLSQSVTSRRKVSKVSFILQFQMLITDEVTKMGGLSLVERSSMLLSDFTILIKVGQLTEQQQINRTCSDLHSTMQQTPWLTVNINNQQVTSK